jgi:hypothetical protein
LASDLHSLTTVVFDRRAAVTRGESSLTTTAVARVLLGLASSLVIMGALTPLDPLGRRLCRRSR